MMNVEMAGEETITRPLRVDAERNLRRLLDAAAQAFAEEGLGVSVAEIARRAGIGKGTVFRRFPTKEHLVAAIVRDRLGEIARLGEELLGAEDAGGALLQFMRAGTAVQAQDRGFLEAAAGAELELEEVLDAKRQLIEVTRELLARAQSQGTVRADVTPNDILLLECACCQASAPLHAAAPELWERYVEIVFDGLRAEAAHPLSQPPPTESQLEQAHPMKLPGAPLRASSGA
jgi:AcrR family transcriptional regulator